jgi:hypothetical protein
LLPYSSSSQSAIATPGERRIATKVTKLHHSEDLGSAGSFLLEVLFGSGDSSEPPWTYRPSFGGRAPWYLDNLFLALPLLFSSFYLEVVLVPSEKRLKDIKLRTLITAPPIFKETRSPHYSSRGHILIVRIPLGTTLPARSSYITSAYDRFPFPSLSTPPRP